MISLEDNTHLSRICKQDIFSSPNLTSHSARPDVLPCIQLTLMTWVPCGFLWLAAVVYVPYLWSRKAVQPWGAISWRNAAKMVTITLLVLGCLGRWAYLVRQARSGGEPLPASYIGVGLEMATFTLAAVLTHWAFRQGQNSPGVLYVFWLLEVQTCIVALRYTVLEKIHTVNIVGATLVYIHCTLVFIQHTICLFADNAALQPSPAKLKDQNVPLLSREDETADDEPAKPHPIVAASFVSRVYFWWFFEKLVLANRRPLTFEDTWAIRPSHSSKQLITKFKRAWDCEPDKATDSKYSTYGGTNPNENEKPPHSGYQNLEGERPTRKRPSLFYALFKVIGVLLVTSQFYLVITVACNVLVPLVLGYFIEFLQTPEAPSWQGYALANILAVMSSMGILAYTHAYYESYRCGVMLRTCVMCAVYRKALRLSSCSRRLSSTGEIINVLSVDTLRLVEFCYVLPVLLCMPVLTCVSVYFQYQVIGPACFSGIFIYIVVLPTLTFALGRWMQRLANEQMLIKDERLKIASQMLNAIQVVKLSAWESYFQRAITKNRDKELSKLRMTAILYGVMSCLWCVGTVIAAVADFVTFTIIYPDRQLDAKTAFTLFAYLNAVNWVFLSTPWSVLCWTGGLVSVKRIEKFLCMDEQSEDDSSIKSSQDSSIKIVNGTFSWDPHDGATLRNISLDLPPGSLVAVVGLVGAGKSSLISALLGEMERVQGTVSVNGSVAYVSQQAWIQNLSLRDNVLFSKPYTEDTYQNVIRACALDSDVEMLPAGDVTEIGERGVNLSGGQKQRVSLARGVYQDADIYLLDDPLSAVDVRVGKHIFDNVLGPAGLLKKKTRLMVTHGITHLSQTDLIVVMRDGRVSEVGDYRQLLGQQGGFWDFINTYLVEHAHTLEDEDMEAIAEIERLTSDSDSSVISEITSRRKYMNRKTKHKRVGDLREQSKSEMRRQIQKQEHRIIEDESSQVGSVGLRTLKPYACSSKVFTFLTLFAFLLYMAIVAANGLWLSAWTNDANKNASVTIVPSTRYRVGIYGTLGALQVVVGIVICYLIAYISSAASRTLHKNLLFRILRCPMSFFDATPVGRILNRFSKDFEYIDKNIPQFLFYHCILIAPIVADLIVILYTLPLMIFPIAGVMIVFFIFQRMYAKCLRQLQRIDSVRSSPVYAFFSEMLMGTSTIRAYKKQDEFISRADGLIDDSARAFLEVFTSNRFINIMADTLTNLIVLIIGVFVVYKRDVLSTSLVSVALTVSLRINTSFALLLLYMSYLESFLVAVERVKEYTDVQSEAPWTLPDHRPPGKWPREGVIEFRNYSVRYREGTDLVLKGVTCHISAGKKVGVVGRTGAGKSSLTLALFRILEAAEGHILIDGVDIASIGLHDLRSKLTIIPQDPELFSGSLRFNLDPSERHNDSEIWTALQQAHLKGFVDKLPQGLDYECGERGENFSVGQRQLVCLARALLGNNKILILDEATAAVDMETDELIQSTIRSELSGCTLITIAHRLNTILDYDCIMVMEAGRLVEMESPKSLLENKSSLFYNMAKNAGITGLIVKT